jgi:hypothetical protein
MKLMKQTLIILTIISFCFFSDLKGQTNTQNISENKNCILVFDSLLNRNIYLFVDTQPEFSNGKEMLVQFIQKNLKFPSDMEFQGSIYVTFIVETDGKLTDKRVYKKEVNNSKPTPAEQAALDVFDKMPNWTSGKCSGQAVPVRMYLPIKFMMKREE